MTTEDVLCNLGSVRGNVSVELSQMESEGEPIAGAPKIDIWMYEKVNEEDILKAYTTLLTDVEDDEYIVRGEEVSRNVDIPHVDGFETDTDRSRDVVWRRVDNIEDAVEEFVRLTKEINDTTSIR